jgi:hypothetical protein
MKPLFRPSNDLSSPARALRPLLGAVLVASAFGAQAQQWTRGQQLWNTFTCAGCHTNQFPLTLMQTAYADNTVGLTRLNAAINSPSVPMSAFRPGGSLALSDVQKSDLAYFISNFRAESNAAPQSSTALQANAEVVIRLFNNGKRPLQIQSNGINLTGANASQFSVRGLNNTCFNLTVAPASFCEVAVRYLASGGASASHTASLVFTHNGEPQGTSTVTVTGAVAPAPSPTPPPPAPGPAPAPAPSSGGGGALPLALWAALLPAALLARRRRT